MSHWQPTTRLLAFGFTNPWLLVGLAAAAVPVVLHFLRRQPVYETDWAAVRFLLAAVRRRARRRRLTEYALLAARVLAVCCLVVAVAGPTSEAPRSTAWQPQPVHFILAVDDSASLQFVPGAVSSPAVGAADGGQAVPQGARDGSGRSLFDQARREALRLVRTARPGDVFTLVRLCGARRTLIELPTPDRQTVEQTLNSLHATELPGRVEDWLDELRRLVRAAPAGRARHVVVFSDLQSSTWSTPTGRGGADWSDAWSDLATRATLTVVDVGTPPSANFAVVDATLSQPFAFPGQPVRLQATVRRFRPGKRAASEAGRQVDRPEPRRAADEGPSESLGPSRGDQTGRPGRSLTVRLVVDGRQRDTRSLQFDSADEQTVRFELAVAEPGEHWVCVELLSDGLSVDNRRWLVLPVRDSLRILLVDGRPVGRPEDRATYFVRKALAAAGRVRSTDRLQPHPEARNKTADGRNTRSAGLFQVETVRDDQLAGLDLTRFDCVFLCDVSRVPETAAAALRRFVRAGGGLVVSLGPSVDPQTYNQQLFGPDNLLPARIGQLVGNASRPQRVFSLNPLGYQHPVLDVFRGNPNAGLESTPIFAYRQLAVEKTPEVHVVLRFDTGDAAVVERTFGAGHVFLVATGLDRTWGAWPVWAPSFVPLLHETVRYCVTGRWRGRVRSVGQPLRRALPDCSVPAQAVLEWPTGRREPVTTSRGTDKTECFLQTPTLTVSGVYRLRFTRPPGRTELYTVNPTLAESDLTRLTEGELQRALAGVPFRHLRTWQPLRRSRAARAASTRSLYSWPLLLAALAFLLSEPALSWLVERQRA